MKNIRIKNVVTYLSFVLSIIISWVFIEEQYQSNQKIYIYLLSAYTIVTPFVLWLNNIKLNFKELVSVVVLFTIFISISVLVENEIDYKVKKNNRYNSTPSFN